MRVAGVMKYGPKAADSPSIGRPCPACGLPFKAGDYTTLVAYGPGDDPEEQAKARQGRPHAVVGAEVHWACATGESGEESEPCASRA